jgi:hypothetical protein
MKLFTILFPNKQMPSWPNFAKSENSRFLLGEYPNICTTTKRMNCSSLISEFIEEYEVKFANTSKVNPYESSMHKLELSNSLISEL